jgi:hypothetical protein
LAQYDGSDPNMPIYLAIEYVPCVGATLSLSGDVYDVSANRRIYGPGGGYGFFAGKDAARAFVTGCFKEDLTHDIRGLDPKQMEVIALLLHLTDDKDLIHWKEFFAKHEKYFWVGKVYILRGVTNGRYITLQSTHQRPSGHLAMEPKWEDEIAFQLSLQCIVLLVYIPENASIHRYVTPYQYQINQILERERHQLRIECKRQDKMTCQHQSQRQTREEPPNLPSDWHCIRKYEHHDNPRNYKNVHPSEIPNNLG